MLTLNQFNVSSDCAIPLLPELGTPNFSPDSWQTTERISIKSNWPDREFIDLLYW